MALLAPGRSVHPVAPRCAQGGVHNKAGLSGSPADRARRGVVVGGPRVINRSPKTHWGNKALSSGFLPASKRVRFALPKHHRRGLVFESGGLGIEGVQKGRSESEMCILTSQSSKHFAARDGPANIVDIQRRRHRSTDHLKQHRKGRTKTLEREQVQTRK